MEVRTTPDRIQALARWRTGLVFAAVVLPLLLFLIFERQARRLDALSARGEPVDALVTAVSRDGGTTFYAYAVGGTEHTWNVARDEAPFPVGHIFPAIYLPDDPSLSRPTTDRGLIAAEAASNRSFTWKVVLAVAVTLLLFVGLAQRDLRRLRAGAPSDLSDRKSYRRRLAFSSVVLLPSFVLIGGYHIQDSLEEGQSVWPVVITLCVCIALAAVSFYFAWRDGPVKAWQRFARVLRWVAPIAGVLALVRLVMFIFGT